MIEDWRPVVGYSGLYEISNTGRVMSVERTVKTKNGQRRKFKSREMTAHTGGMRVTLCRNGKGKCYDIRKLKKAAFGDEKPVSFWGKVKAWIGAI